MRASFIVMASAAALIAACDKPQAPLPATEAPAEPGAYSFESWLGRWTGPEGTFLDVQRSGAGFELTIQSLDGPARYPAQAAGDRLEFERDGQREGVRATDGQATGMKWLLDKRDCLTIKPGEGFCRD